MVQLECENWLEQTTPEESSQENEVLKKVNQLFHLVRIQ